MQRPAQCGERLVETRTGSFQVTHIEVLQLEKKVYRSDIEWKRGLARYSRYVHFPLPSYPQDGATLFISINTT